MDQETKNKADALYKDAQHVMYNRFLDDEEKIGELSDIIDKLVDLIKYN